VLAFSVDSVKPKAQAVASSTCHSMTDSPGRGLLVSQSICRQPSEYISDVQTGNMACT